ncbi:MAG: co-chaperone GroES [Undibacterium sp.]
MAKVRIQPLGENVLVKIAAKESKTKSGLYLPESTNGERGQQGVVVATGDHEEITVKKGDTVIFKRYGSSEEVKIADEEHVLLSYKDILAIVHE